LSTLITDHRAMDWRNSVATRFNLLKLNRLRTI